MITHNLNARAKKHENINIFCRKREKEMEDREYRIFVAERYVFCVMTAYEDFVRTSGEAGKIQEALSLLTNIYPLQCMKLNVNVGERGEKKVKI